MILSLAACGGSSAPAAPAADAKSEAPAPAVEEPKEKKQVSNITTEKVNKDSKCFRLESVHDKGLNRHD